MRHVAALSLSVLSFSLLSLAACGRSTTDGDSKSDKGSSKSTSESTASKSTGGGPAAGADKPSDPGISAPPADPLQDGSDVIASCDQPKDDGACTEHYALGLGEDSSKQFCENAMKGTWLKGKNCPKDGRMFVCRTDVDRMIYYKNAFQLQGPKEMAKLCTDTLSGKWGEFPKGK
jgi:hypothetical protein